MLFLTRDLWFNICVISIKHKGEQKWIFLSYTPEQMNEIVEFISQKYAGDGYIAHETNSEYVHTDVNISSDGEMRKFVTFGMGAAKMNSPFEEFTRVELVMSSS